MGFNAKKAAQTIVYFALKNNAEPLDKIKAVKLVYLADRESIARFGFPIQDEQHVSMKHGPVNSNTYSYMNGEHQNGWQELLKARENHQIGLANSDVAVDDLDELSDADLQVLDAVWERFGAMGTWVIRDWTHDQKNVPEWEDPNGSSFPIPMSRIMSFLGIENADQQVETIADFNEIDDLFAAL